MSDVVLQARGVSVTLGGRAVLSGAGVTLAAGKIVVLVGPNGSGKTTLLRAALGHVAISAGTVDWLGRPLIDWPRRELAKTAAYLPQSPTFEPGDRVIDVLRLGRAPYGGLLGLDAADDDAAIVAVAKDVAVDDLLGRNIETLSGGQRQRVFLGRALVQRPRAVLLDEPATYLDVRHQVELHALLGRLAREQGLAVLMASHDINLAAAHADEAVVLKDGRVLAAGPVGGTMTETTLGDAFDVRVRAIADGGRTVFVV